MTDREPQVTRVVRHATGTQKLVFDRFSLTVTKGIDAGLTRAFGQETVQLGTARPNDLVLRDPTVSRFHARIETAGASFTLVDLDSTNGTYLGGYRFRTAYLEGEALVTLGNTGFRFCPLGDQAELVLPDQDHMGALLGGSERMRALYAAIERVAEFDVPVVIEGETGTGKAVGRIIHERSRRAAEPLEVLDCGSLPETLIESELFGHQKGAFTGADRDRPGIFERADGGTVFLDEIGEMKLSLQPKLLRVLETGEVKRVGDGTMRRVNVRLVAATNRSLAELINKNEFREDLYYRLAGHKMRVPPLRERREDIPLLVEHFLARLREQGHPSVPKALNAETIEAFMAFPWPGNVRQLRRAVERFAMFGVAELTDAHGLAREGESSGGDPSELPLRAARDVFERQYLTKLMQRVGGDIKKAGALSQMHPKSLLRLLRRYAIDELP